MSYEQGNSRLFGEVPAMHDDDVEVVSGGGLARLMRVGFSCPNCRVRSHRHGGRAASQPMLQVPGISDGAIPTSIKDQNYRKQKVDLKKIQ